MYIFQDFKGMNPIKTFYSILIGSTLRAIFLYRLSSWFYNHHIKILSTIFWSLNIALHSCDISPSAKIGKGFYIYHSVGLVIGAGATIGKNFTIYQNTTIGTNKIDRYPVIGNGVTLFAGSIVIGDITIGDNVTIGANSVVTKDIPSNSTAKGIPAVF